MRKTHATSVDVEHARSDRLRQTGGRAAPTRRGLDELDRGARKPRNDERDVPGCRSQARKSLAHKHSQAVGNRERLARTQLRLALKNGPRQLESEEGITTRGGVQLGECRARELRIQAGTKHAIHRVEVERTDEQAINASLRERSIETERNVARRLPSLGDEDADWLLLEPANDELERNCRGPIQPLDIVNGDHDWAHLRE